jgi:D-glycero-alpha-D-manno-heptose-7-phosphate kinase
LAMKNLKNLLQGHSTQASAPCRIDCGGTLDIKTFYYPLRHLSPCTFNVALDMKTRVQLLPHEPGLVRVSSRNFQTEEYPADSAPFNSPLGLMFAVAAYFQVEGVHINIVSESPPRSGLGGSSTAAVALIAAFSMALYGRVSQEKTVLLAHAIEEAVAGVPCGMQDQLAAAYGGVHAWYWPSEPTEPPFKKLEVLTKRDHSALAKRLLVAYCGVPHQSRDTNSQWVQQFVSGKVRSPWIDIVNTTKAFVKAVCVKDWASAVHAMNEELEIRRTMTPEVFGELGEALLEGALAHGCGARFTGAGGGGCLWALGEADDVRNLRSTWTELLSQKEGARLLQARVDPKGLEVT